MKPSQNVAGNFLSYINPLGFAFRILGVLSYLFYYVCQNFFFQQTPFCVFYEVIYIYKRCMQIQFAESASLKWQWAGRLAKDRQPSELTSASENGKWTKVKWMLLVGTPQTNDPKMINWVNRPLYSVIIVETAKELMTCHLRLCTFFVQDDLVVVFLPPVLP